ncbi:hypothetical protein B0H13DRAFT_2350977 [Mycena leptocephala]|nr:hypothetical protein B0H13DRAFT_2350977 [Mycena leptocephala]
MPFLLSIRSRVGRSISKARRTLHIIFHSKRGSMALEWGDHPPSRTSIHGDWYIDPTLPQPWSTDWDAWDSLRLFEDTVDGELMIDKLFKDIWEVPGVVKPLAYIVSTGGLCFLFTAGGRYYYWSDGRLTVHRMEFESPKEFLDYALKKDGTHMPDQALAGEVKILLAEVGKLRDEKRALQFEIAELMAIKAKQPPPEAPAPEPPAAPPAPAPGGWRTVHAPHVPRRKQLALRAAASPAPPAPPPPPPPAPELPAWAQWRPNPLLAPGTAAGPTASVVVPPPPRSGLFGARTPPPK